jgi:hypothetical protein
MAFTPNALLWEILSTFPLSPELKRISFKMITKLAILSRGRVNTLCAKVSFKTLFNYLALLSV